MTNFFSPEGPLFFSLHLFSPQMAQLSPSMSVQQETTARRLTSSAKHPGVEERNTKNLDYVTRSGLAGGLAGCMVRNIVVMVVAQIVREMLMAVCRQRPSLLHWTESRFCSKHGTLSLRNMLVGITIQICVYGQIASYLQVLLFRYMDRSFQGWKRYR
jgi:hypothetical protein